MDPMIKEEHHGDYGNGQWVDIQGYHTPQLQSPAHDFNGFSFMPSTHHAMPMEPSYNNRPMPPLYSAPQHPPPLFTAQWPSMLTNPSSHLPLAPLPTPPPLAPVSTFATAHPLPPLTTPIPTTTTRRTLTDQDRRRMCQYHEDNPSVKQTEIGAMFGVERSTVSKVLRQKDKYLSPDDGSRSPIKRAKGKFPDIERALSNWAKNHQRQGLPLNDSVIRDKARFFATTVGSSDSHLKVNSTSWLEKFKQKNGLLGAKARKISDANDSDSGFQGDSQSGSQTPNGISPISPTGVGSPSPLSPVRSRDSLKSESTDAYIDFSASYRHVHSQSATSLASCFTDPTAISPFSAGPQSPTSPCFPPDGNCGASPFMPSHHARMIPIPSSNAARPRSQTFPMLGIEPNFSQSSASPETLTPKQLQEIMSSPPLTSPHEELAHSPLGLVSDLQLLSHPASNAQSPNQSSSPLLMAPPQTPLMTSSNSTSTSICTTINNNNNNNNNNNLSPTTSISSSILPPSQSDARRALELVMDFFQSQASGVAVNPQEYIVMGSLMEKLKVQGSPGSGGGGGGGGGGGEMPGGMHSIDVEGKKEMARKRSIHTL